MMISASWAYAVTLFEIDVEVIGGIAETVGAKIGREFLAGFFGDIDPSRCADRFDVFVDCEPADEILLSFSGLQVVDFVDDFGGPGSAAVEPIAEEFLFVVGQRFSVLGHVVRFDVFPEQAFGRFPGNKQLAAFTTGEDGDLSREIEAPLVRSVVVAFEAVFDEQPSDLGLEQMRVLLSFCSSEDGGGLRVGSGVVVFLNVSRIQGAVVDRNEIERPEPRSIVGVFVGEC